MALGYGEESGRGAGENSGGQSGEEGRAVCDAPVKAVSKLKVRTRIGVKKLGRQNIY